MYAGMPRAPHTGATDHTWSMWPWVSSTATGFSRCSATMSAIPVPAPSPGSMITHSAPGSGATRKQLAAKEPAGNPVISTGDLLRAFGTEGGLHGQLPPLQATDLL